MKEAVKKSASSSGIMSINKNIVNEVERDIVKYIKSAEKAGVNLDDFSEEKIKYIIQLNRPKPIKAIPADSPEGEGITRDLFNMIDRRSGKNVIKTDFGGKGSKIETEAETKKKLDELLGPDDDVFGSPIKDWHMEKFKKPKAKDVTPKKEIDVVTETVTKIKTMKPIDAMKEANSVIGRKGKYKNLTIEESQEILKKTDDHIFERDIKYDEFGEIIKPDPEDLAGGGIAGILGERMGYGSGGPLYSESDYHILLSPFRPGGQLPGLSDYDDDVWDYDVINIGGSMKKPLKKKKKKKKESKAGGGRTGTGLNYLMGEDDQNMRVPFSLGSMGRRKFLQWLGAGAATAGAAKSGLLSLIKSGKPTAEVLSQVPIKNIKGMPPWFKPLVNQIIRKGNQVESGAERVIVHKTKLPNSKTDIYVEQDLNTGDVVVDIGMGKHGWNQGHLGQPVRLEYKASEWIEPNIEKWGKEIKPSKKVQKTKEEFWVEEAEFTGGHPENIKFEESTFSKFGEHGSDFSEVEKFATGKIKKKTIKESLKAERAHWTPEGDYASGGRVPLSGGGGSDKLEEAIRAYRKYQGSRKNPRLNFKTFFKVYAKENFASGGRVSLSAGGLAGMLGE